VSEPVPPATAATSEDVTFQVRLGCGPASEQLVNNYTVNRRTAEVTLASDNPQRMLMQWEENTLRASQEGAATRPNAE
jgi:hypothetical protein